MLKLRKNHRRWKRSTLHLKWSRFRIASEVNQNIIAEWPMPLESGHNNGDVHALLNRIAVPVLSKLIAPEIFLFVVWRVFDRALRRKPPLALFDDKPNAGGLYWFYVIEKPQQKLKQSEYTSLEARI